MRITTATMAGMSIGPPLVSADHCATEHSGWVGQE
jgi:hypothetical protein